ncbi:DUF3526 domain-containing protein [uncultured Algimonas sp.]|uniref:DUF3526 domain-containing protein n=1 Tax=uncultured Algimonas sp. TaxID=1547920 RepID=UPI0026199A2F|nr:DUF3526 domain-containing protein [uncultured Algimonas sp.]
MIRELRFLLRDRAAMLWIALAFILSATAVTLGLAEVRQQQAELAEIDRLDRADRAQVLSEQSDWGGAAYSTFHLTSDPPSDFAFAALGQRDVSPWKHRIRMLALEGQIYETDATNPDFALTGRFDFAFVAALIAPLLLILLLFDLRSGERAAGRLELIEASGAGAKRVWRTRTILRVGGLAVALILPLWIGGAVAGTSVFTLLAAALAVTLYLAFWAWLSRTAGSAAHTGSVNLTILLGLWLLICAVIPAMLTQAIDGAVPLPDGGDIVLTQREAVNDAWDLPKDATMSAFLDRHPEWEAQSGIDRPFEWKWYYAFQQVGDQTVEPLSRAYREGRAERDRLVGFASLVSPATALQRGLERLAETDVRASLAYEARVRDYHARLRAWHYPNLFEDRDFSVKDADGLPAFDSGDAT